VIVAGTSSGKISIDVEADLSKFASQLAKDLNAAIKGVRLDMGPVSKQLSEGVEKGVEAGTKAIDKFAKRAGNSFSNVSDSARRMGATIASSMDESVGEAASRIVNIRTAAERTASSTAAAFQRAGKAISGVGDQMTYGLTLPIVATGAVGVKAAADFEKSMNLVRAVSGVTGDTFVQLRDQAIQLGSTTQFSASQAAEAMYYLSSAGFSAQQMYEAMPGVLNLAASGAIDLGTAADIASNILNGFGLKASQLTRVNDVLAKTMSSSAVNMQMLNDTFKYAGPVASSLGVSLEELAAAAGLMGNAGIKGEMAGTALRGSLVRLINPPKEAAAALQRLGVQIKDSHGKILPLVDIIGQLEKKGASTADVMSIFGLEAGPGMQALLSQGSGALRKLTGELQNAGGTADRMAKIQMEGFTGAWLSLKSAIEGLQIAIGDSGVLQDLTDLIIAITGWVAALGKSNPELLKAAFYFGTFVAAIGPVLAIGGRLVGAFETIIIQAKKLWPIIKSAGTAVFAFFGSTVGIVIVVIAALIGILVYAYFHVKAFRDICDQAFRAVGTVAMWLWNNAIKPAFTAIWTAMRQVGAFVANLWQTSWYPALRGMGQAVVNAWNTQIRPAFAALGAALVKLGAAIAAWWTGGGREAFANAGKAISWWWTNAVLPAIKGVILVLGLLGFALGWVFINIALPIFTLVITAIRWIVVAFTWLWNIARPVTQFLATAFTAIGNAAVWLWNNAIVPAFHAIVAVIRFVVSVVGTLWSIGVAVFQGIAAVLRVLWGVATTAFQGITTAIGWVVAAATWFWGTFGPLFVAVGRLVWAIVSGVFLIAFDLIKLGFMIVVGAAMLFWAGITVVFRAVAAVVMAFYNAAIAPIVNAVAAIFMWLWGNVIGPVLSAIGAAFAWLWGVAVAVWSAVASVISSVVSAVGDRLNALWKIAVLVWNAIVATVSAAVSRVVATASRIAAFVSTLAGYFTLGVNTVRDKINAITSIVSSIPGRIISAIGNIGSLLVNAGKNVINGLINGIESRISALRQKIANAAQTIRDALPFSPAKEGPLSGRGDPTIAGGVIVQMVAEGIRADLPDLRLAAFDIGRAAQAWWPTATAQAGQPPNLLTQAGVSTPGITIPPRPPATDTGGTRGGGNTYNVTVNSLDPKAAGPLVIDSIKSFERTNGKGWRAP
jgi:TP901 family phage tail tape measure protein